MTFLGFSVFFALSFMAAETLTRAAFGDHPQFWRVWSRGSGSSTAILGRTAGGYLLVSLFFAYDVLLYLVTTRVFGWWSPAEALLHPDVLATYAPWLSAIANSFQAGFWEECLFRAVPLAGAALIGDRFGKRRLFLVIAFIVQAAVFGAGHAPYPNQPSFARPVELIIPSIGFGLLYLYFGLLPGIVLHFTFDVVWFALPVFIAVAPGIWFQQFMIVALTLVPLWVVLWRRLQAGRWTVLAPEDRNAAWVPPPAVERQAAASPHRALTLGPRARGAWLIAGGVALLGVLAAVMLSPRKEMFTVTRAQALEQARQAVAARGVSLGPRWRLLPLVDNGAGAPHEFVSRTAGEARRLELARQLSASVALARAGRDLRRRSRRARGGVGRARRSRWCGSAAGAHAARGASRRIARRDCRARHRSRGLESATSPRCNDRTGARGFRETVEAESPDGLDVHVRRHDDRAASAGRTANRRQPRGRRNRQRAPLRLRAGRLGAAGTGRRDPIDDRRILAGVIFGGLLLAAAVLGVIVWSRGRYAPVVFVLGAALMLAASLVNAANGYPTILASLSTAQPLPLQLAAVAGVGLVGLTLVAALVGLALGAVPRRLVDMGRLPDRDAILLGIAGGLVAAGVAGIGTWLRTPPWARLPDIAALNTAIPFVEVATDPIAGFLTRLAVLLAMFIGIDRLTNGWTRWRIPAAIALAARRLRCRRTTGRRSGVRLVDGRRADRRRARGRVRDASSDRSLDDAARAWQRRYPRRIGARRAAALPGRAARLADRRNSDGWRGVAVVPCPSKTAPECLGRLATAAC